MPNDPANPWSFDYFAPTQVRVPPPSPRTHTPKLVPDEDTLFSLQRNLLKVLNHMDHMESTMNDLPKEWQVMRQDAENAYRNINRYLRENVQGGLPNAGV